MNFWKAILLSVSLIGAAYLIRDSGLQYSDTDAAVKMQSPIDRMKIARRLLDSATVLNISFLAGDEESQNQNPIIQRRSGNEKRGIPEEPVLLTACSMIQNEAPYIVEWIEFMRIQGVQRFVIYDDNSTDDIRLLTEFYHQRDRTFEIHIFPVVGPEGGDVSAGTGRQSVSFQHCLETFRDKTRWMMVLDVDEFLYSPAFGTLAHLLGNISDMELRQNETINILTSMNLNFGSSGQLHRFEYRLVRRKGIVAYANGCGVQLLTDHVLRGPHPYARPEKDLYDNLTAAGGLWICQLPGSFSPCRHNPGKSLFRPQHVLEAGVHHPQAWRPGTPACGPWYSPTPLLRGNHYYYRSREDVERKAAQWGMAEHVRNYNLTDRLLWGRVRDGALRERWGAELARRMRGLVSVGGKCDKGREVLDDRGDSE